MVSSSVLDKPLLPRNKSINNWVFGFLKLFVICSYSFIRSSFLLIKILLSFK